MGVISKGQIEWGEWGTYSFNSFLRDFKSSEEFMKAPLWGYCSLDEAILELLDSTVMSSRRCLLDFKKLHSSEEDSANFKSPICVYGDSYTPELPRALYEFATRTVPCRMEDILGRSVVTNPQRDRREGARPSIPLQAPDIFKWILDGDDSRGHAIVVEFDQETQLGYDDLFSTEISSRRLFQEEAHAVSIVNKFPAYVRFMDDKLFNLLERIGFISYNKFRDGKPSILKSIPFGLNFVGFPFNYSDSLSSIPIFDLYSIMRSVQKSLDRGINDSGLSDMFYDVFFNIGCLAGGTIPRMHMQAYLRTKIDPNETQVYNPEGMLKTADFSESDMIRLDTCNRNWQAYSPLVRNGRFDVKLELKNGKNSFRDLDNFELWDAAEALVEVSATLDKIIGIPERNIQFFPTGIVVRPFVVYGGHEGNRFEMIQGQPSYQFAKTYNNNLANLKRSVTYTTPNDDRGKEHLEKLIDESSPIFLRAA